MNKHWEKISTTNTNIFNAYDKKYGSYSNYSDSQDIFFNDPEVLSNLKRSISSFDFSNKKMLSLGINNGREITEFIKYSHKSDWSSTHITGIDLSLSALKEAKKNLVKLKAELINGDITSFGGVRIRDKKRVCLPKNSYDFCVACTSLQSTNLYKNNSYKLFISNLVGLMKDKSTILVIAPNCTIQNGRYVGGGTFIAEKDKQDPSYTVKFIKKTARVLRQNGYKIELYGDKFIFLVACR